MNTIAIIDPDNRLVVAATSAETAWRIAATEEGRSRFTLQRLGYHEMPSELIERVEMPA